MTKWLEDANLDRIIRIFDTTLRDGEQSPGCSMNIEEKLEIAKQLERLRVDVIEAGFAVSSPGDFESVSRIAETIKDSMVASLARALKKDIDAAYEATRKAAAPMIHTFISTSPVHMEYKLRMKPEEVLERTREMVAYARSKCRNVEFSAEDATRSDPAFLARIITTAIEAGASCVNIPDTVGYTVPEKMVWLIRYLYENVPNIGEAIVSVHCHNDLGMAVANSLAAVSAGAGQVECTINGLGERAGNAALEEIVMALATRRDYFGATCRIDTTQIYRASRLVYGIVGVPVPLNKAIVGANAFSHESGIHQHGIMAERTTYEIMMPESIGLTKSRIVLGKHSGRHAFKERVEELGYKLNDEQINKFFEEFKVLCDKKKVVSDSDIEAIINNRLTTKNGAYKLVRFDLQSGNLVKSMCTVVLERDGETFEDVALGDGPVNAAYNAIDKIVEAPERKLEDYSIHSISSGEDALGEVVIKLRSGKHLITGHGLSVDIMEASILAYINGINKLVEMGDRYDEDYEKN
ncbi:MAG: 2-isopropylmalate synthase [Eubacteriales bacterium]|jgi:2-isopropylmalate synthase|nr:2-isopropylmalate synthase [Clostridiales bacterium]